MSKKLSNSRLKETAFSQFNLRDAYITDMSSYVSSLRDESIFSNYGLQVLIRVPILNDDVYSNNVDEYSNFVNTEWLDTTESVIPLFKEYREVLSEHGLTADGTEAAYPLQIIIPTKLYLPRDSRIILNEYDCNDNKVAREWQVLGTMRKQLSNGITYANVANCVPARQTTYDAMNLSGIQTIWFDGECKENTVQILKTIRAQGTMWFVNKSINDNESVKVLDASIFEQASSFPIINEEVELLYYYDTRSKNIVNAGTNFVKNEEFLVLDNNGKQIYIETDKIGNKVALKLTVTSVNNTGGITGFELNIQSGYTFFGTEGITQITLSKTGSSSAVINLISTIADGDIYNETLETEIIEKPKYFNPYKVNAVFVTKKIVATIVN